MADETLPPEDLGRAAYEAEAAWLDEIMPGGRGPSWEDLDPEHQEVYQWIAGAVAAAERERIRQLAIRNQAVCTGDEGTCCYFADLIGEPSVTAAQPRAHSLTRYKKGPDEHGMPGKGCRCPQCRAANTAWQANRDRMIAYGRWAPLVAAAGTQRRLQALMRNGWSWGVLAARLGIPRQRLRAKLCRHQHVTPATAAAVRGLYDQLWDQPPPERTPHERAAATRSRRYAQERGWPPPLGWDEETIDDPAASPADGWERRDGVRRWGVLAEDAADLLRAGEEPEQVAERLGVTRSTLSTVLTRAARKQAGASRAA